MFEWDQNKNIANLQKHGLSLKEASEIFDTKDILIKVDNRRNYGEVRFIALGCLSEYVVILVVYTKRNGYRRLISARIAKQKERQTYHEHFKKTPQSA